MSAFRITPHLSLIALLGLLASACSNSDDDRVKCSNTTECAPDESCSAGFCERCTPGVDCPEKDVDSGDSSDVTNSDADSSDDTSDADVDIAADADAADSDDAGPDAPGPDDELACEGEQTLLTYDEGRAFEVRFGERSTGLIALPEGWTIEPGCCAAGCCQ